MSYKDRYRQLVREAHNKGLSVRQVRDRTTRDFVGMNSQAAKSFGLKMRPNTIHIDKNLDSKTKCHTLQHEMVEFGLMKKGMKYWPAHRRALKAERKLT